MKAPLPKKETKRLDVLRAYKILDTPPEAPFDELTFLASHIRGTPMALVSLVDEADDRFARIPCSFRYAHPLKGGYVRGIQGSDLP